MAENQHTGNPSARQALLDLAERCEREEPSWQLTCEIEAALNQGAEIISLPYSAPFLRKPGRDWRPSPYTTSLDAAVTLVPEGFAWSAGSDTRGDASVDRWGEVSEQGAAKTAALALCAASLRARAAETE